MKIIALLLGSFFVTSYRSVPSQTDNSPFRTSINERTNVHGVAVSQDLLAEGVVHYGDLVYIQGVGLRFVNDCMNERWTNRFDVWVESIEDEHRFERKFKGKKLKIYLVRLNINETKRKVHSRTN